MVKIASALSLVGCGLAGSNRPQTDSFWTMIVSTPVGWTELARMPCCANSTATVRMMPIDAVLGGAVVDRRSVSP